MTATSAEAAKPMHPGLMMGMAELANDRPRMAAAKFQMALKADESDHRSRYGLVKALDALGRCAEVMRHVAVLETSRFWMPEAMVAAGTCEADVGAWSSARSLYEEAISRETSSAEPPYRLGRLCLELGDEACVASSLETTLEREAGGAYAAMLEAELAVRSGAPDADAHLVALGVFGDLPAARKVRALLLVQRLLDEGDAIAAEAYSLQVVTQFIGDQSVAAMRAETLRRAGDTIEALGGLERPTLRVRPDPVSMANVRARVLADLGHADEAWSVVAGLPTDLPEVMATRWYLARLAGDEAAMAQWAARMKAHPIEGWRPLERLIPITEESP